MKKVIYFIVLFGLLATIFVAKSSFAITAEEVQEQIENTNSQIAEIDKQIAKYQKQIAQTAEEKATLARLIKELTLTRDNLVAEKNKTQKKITATGLVIQELNSNIVVQQNSIEKSKASLAKMLADVYFNDNYTITERLLAQDNLTEASKEYNDFLAINKELQQYLDEVRAEKASLESTKVTKETEQKNLQELKQNLTLKQQAIEASKKEKDRVLAETKNKEAEYQRILAEQLKRKETFEKAIADYEAQLQFILNPKLLPKEGSGVLSWPLSSILITSIYGPRWGSFHYGVDFRATVGTNVFAMASGTVEGTGDTDIACKGASFGKWVFIKHDNGLSSTYGHLSVISVKEGQKVKAGTIIGLSGNTGSSTGPHLHVNVYASTGVSVDTVPSKSCGGKVFTQPIAALNAYLNPLNYLPKTTKDMFK